MKIALDPFMLRHVPLTELPAVVAELGYEYIELSRARTSPRSSCTRGPTPSGCGSSGRPGRGRGAGRLASAALPLVRAG